MSMSGLDVIFNTLQPYLIGFIVGIATMFASGYTKEYFEERASKAKHKRDVARQVLIICNEASSGSFRKAAREMEHVNSVMTDLEGIDKEMEEAMVKMVSSWGTVAREKTKGNLSPYDVKFIKDQLDRAEENRKILIGWANKIRY